MNTDTRKKTTPPISDRAGAIRSSPTLAVSSRAAKLRAQGKDIISLGSGEPDFDTPEHIKQAAIAAIKAGHTKYTPVDGIPQLKQAVANKLLRENQLRYPTEAILISCGCKHSLYNLTQALLNPGDEVILPTPYWVSYPEMVRLTGAEPKFVKASKEQQFKISPKQLEEAINPQTRMFLLNSPNNPTGAYYQEEELAELGEILKKHQNIWIVTDDIYEHILWDKKPFKNIINQHPELKERTILCNGVSKAYAMTGWRIGYAAGPTNVIQAMKKIQSQSTSNPSSIAQYAATAAMNGPQEDLQKNLNIFKQRHDYVHQRLSKMPHLDCPPAAGTFYLFPDLNEAIKRINMDDIQFAEHLLEKAGIALVPGSAFGDNGHYRISFSTEMQLLKKAMDRLEKTLTAL